MRTVAPDSCRIPPSKAIDPREQFRWIPSGAKGVFRECSRLLPGAFPPVNRHLEQKLVFQWGSEGKKHLMAYYVRNYCEWLIKNKFDCLPFRWQSIVARVRRFRRSLHKRSIG